MKLRLVLVFGAWLLAGMGSRGIAATSFTWTGAGLSLLSDDDSNWAGGKAPQTTVTSATDTALVFPAIATSAFPYVFLNSNLDVYSLTFSGAFPAYTVYAGTNQLGQPYSFGLGAGGITVGSQGSAEGGYLYTDLRLLANQTWNVEGRLNVFSGISGGYALTKTGAGTLILGSNTFSGGFTLQQGTLLLDSGSLAEAGTVYSGPVGTGLLRLGANTTLAANDYGVTLDNPILLESGAAFGRAGASYDLTLTGLISLQSKSTTITLHGDGLTNFANTLADAQEGPTTVTFTGGGAAVLSGSNTYSGGTVVDGAGVIFYTGQSIPATGSIGALNNAYVGAAFDGGVASLVGKIGSPAAFAGSLGLDSPRTYDGALVFTDTINLTSFSASNLIGLGTYSSATLAGSITPVGAGDYKFGGGNGTLYVTTSLPGAGKAGVTVSSPVTYTEDQRLTVYLRGENSFTGNVNVSGSNLIFDGGAALPAGVSISLGNQGYAGYSENATNIADFESFRGRFLSGYASTGIIGIDSVYGTRSVSDPINLSPNAPVYLGTATAANLTGTITPPSGGTLFLTGVNGGYLQIGSALTTANGVAAVKLGYANSSPAWGYDGYVELDSGDSNYSGNTTLDSGFLLLGASSVLGRSGIASGPIGTGTLAISPAAHSPGLAVTSSNGVVLHNNISLGTNLAIRADLFTPAYTGYSLALEGIVSGAGGITYTGYDGVLTLSGGNTFSGGFSAVSGEVHANNNSAFGTGPLEIDGAFVRFDTGAPVINGINGSYGTLMVNVANATLQINQQRDGEFGGEINSNGNNITVTKTGSAALTLSGSSTYTGTTNINQGKLVLASGSFTEGSVVGGPVGASTIALNGGELQILHGNTINNPIVFAAPARLSGNATFGAPLTVGTNATIAPGASPGYMAFESGLTFAGGGAYEIDIQSANGIAGVGYDTLSINGTLAFTATTGSPFRLDLISLSASGAAGAVSDFLPTSAYSWVIASTTGGVTGFNPAAMTINATGFTNALSGGAFSVTTSGNSLLLNFTPVPEPSTWALLALGLGGFAIAIGRRRKTGP